MLMALALDQIRRSFGVSTASTEWLDPSEGVVGIKAGRRKKGGIL